MTNAILALSIGIVPDLTLISHVHGLGSADNESARQSKLNVL